MVTQSETLDRLNSEKDYEDKLAKDLDEYYLLCLDDIYDLDADEKEKLKKGLSVITSDSQMHSHKFAELIQMVVQNGEDNY